MSQGAQRALVRFVLICVSGLPALVPAAAATGSTGSGGPASGASKTATRPLPSVPVSEAADGSVTATSGPVVRHPARMQPHRRADGRASLTSPTPIGYTPAQLRAHLGLTGTGAGQTIAVVTAYDAPTIEKDLATFDATFRLPAPPSFRKIDARGGTRYPRTDGGWALEAALDVQWAHAIAPAASIVLVEAKSSALEDLLAAVDQAAKQPGVSVISNSWGTFGEFSGQAAQDFHCALTTAVCVQATGDDGNPGGYPAYNPSVLAVGGTSLTLGANGSVVSESAWSGSGGGVSGSVAKPAYQSASPYPRRSIPDVSYNGDPATGVAVFSSTKVDKETGWFQMGGTSAGTPQWAGIVAVANSLRAKEGKSNLVAVRGSSRPLHAAIYGAAGARAPSLFDVLSGSNGTCGSVCTATAGLDAVTGVGSPRQGIDVTLASSP